jgi:hypothetical protein
VSSKPRFMGFSGVPVTSRGLPLAHYELLKMYRGFLPSGTERKNDNRFVLPSRLKFLRRNQKPLRIWQKKSREVVEELENVVQRGM